MKTLFYWNRVKNFGDLLNIDLFKRVFNYEFLSVDNPYRADAVAIGSLFQCFYKQKNINFDKSQVEPIKVYGTGFWSSPSFDIEYIRNFDIKTVRGNLTKQYFIEKGLAEISTPVGDYAIFAPLYFKKNIEKKYKLGILPHYKDLRSPIFFEIFKNNSKSTIINPMNEPDKVIEQILSCETLISSSLHGLIIADSFNIPNLWLEDDLKMDFEPQFKYIDYYSIYNNWTEFAPVRAIDFIGKDTDYIINNYKVDYNNVKEIQKKLFNSVNEILSIE